jgi:hypothetical protein
MNAFRFDIALSFEPLSSPLDFVVAFRRRFIQQSS